MQNKKLKCVLLMFVSLIFMHSICATSYGDILPVSQRTIQVQEAIVAALPDVTAISDVTDSHLATITSLNLRAAGITKLKTGDFSGMSALTNLNLYQNNLSTLPIRIFQGLTALTTLRLGMNVFDPMPLIVTLINIEGDQYKVVVPTGAPHTITLPINTTNEGLTSEFTTINIPIGAVESAVFTVPVGSTKVEIGTFPNLPRNHYGYTLAMSSACHRSAQVRRAIVNAVPGINDCRYLTDDHLATIQSLNLEYQGLTSLRTDDFLGLTSLRTLYLGNNLLTTLPEDVFKDLSNLTDLYIQNNKLNSLPEHVFSKLTSIRQLNLHGNELTSLPRNLFTDLPSLTQIFLHNNKLTTLDADVFSDVSTLKYLYLFNNKITTLPDNVFSGITKLEHLLLNNNELKSLPTGVFRGMSTPTLLWLHINAVNPLPLLVTLEKVEEGNFKVIVPSGAPFDIEIRLNVTNGELNIESNSITISAGSVESDVITITRTDGVNAAVTVDVDILSNLPFGHLGYFLAKSEALPLEVINATNSAPIFSDGESITRTVAENSVAGVNIGKAVSATDADDDQLTYTLSGTDAESFDIDITTGQLKTKAPLDYETMDTYAITISASDSELSDSIAVTIKVTDVNDAPVFTDGNDTSRSVVENVDIGVNIGTPITATDVDSSTLTYTLGGLHANLFEIEGDTGQLKTKIVHNYEDQSFYQITITVSDGLLGAIIVVNINISDENDAPVFTEGVSTTRTVAEKTLEGVELGAAVTATDEDNDTLIYSLGGADADVFDLDTTNGQLKTKKTLDFETQTTYKVTLTVTDGKLTDTIEVTITVLDIDETIPNRAPVFTEGDATTRTIAENTAAGVDIGPAITATDLDGNTLVYSLGGEDAASFAIVGSTGQLQTKSSLDYETKNSYTVVVNVSDGNGGNDAISVTINITDLNESLPIIPLTGVCDRTPQVRDAIVAAVDVDSCELVTDSHLVTISTLLLSDKQITSLKDGDFSGLSALTDLRLSNNQMTSLPTGIFDDLSSLTYLSVSNNKLSSLPDGVFDGLSALTDLYLGDNQLTGVSVGMFDGLSSLERLSLRSNQITSLSSKLFDGLSSLQYLSFYDNALSSVSSDAFDGLSSLEILELHSNKLTSLPSGVFDGLSSLHSLILFSNELSSLGPGVFTGLTSAETLYLNLNPGVPFAITVSLQKVAETQFKAVMPIGAPFTVVLPLSITNGTISGGASSITIPAGSTESSLLTTTRTPDTTGGVVVNIGTLPNKPIGHLGYELVKSNELPLTIISQTEPTNTAPTFTEGTKTSRSIAENTATNTNIGNAVTATDTDDDNLTYTIGGADAESFDIDSTNGQLKTKVPLNYETKASYTVTVTVSDSLLSDTIDVTINITNVNEAPIFADGESITRSISENTAADVNIGTAITATDVDGNTLTYTLGGADAESFDIDSENGQLMTKVALDYETKASYTIKIIVSDGVLTDTINVSINVIDVDESVPNSAPIFSDGETTTRSVAENTAAETHIGQPVSATDVDNNTLSYSLSGTDAATFGIESTNGQLKTIASLDYETKNTYTVIVTANDGSLTDTITVTINVTNVNEAPTFAEGESTNRSIPENTESDANIGTAVSATDVDSSSLVYTLGGTDAASFDIVSTSGQLKTKANLDRETKSAYSVSVIVSDGNLTDTITVTISITNVNEAPTFAEGESTNRSIPENTESDANIGTAVSATDVDSSSLTYTLDGTDAASFDIVSTSGQLKTKASLDRETKDTYSVSVIVSDGNLTDTITVTITITNVNEAPTFTSENAVTFRILENTASDMNIGDPLSATDGDNDTLTYSLSGTDANSFNIESSTGQLKTSDALDYETKSTYSVTVSVDDSNGGTDSIAVTISVIDKKEAPIFKEGTSTTRSVPENTASGENIGDPIVATDDDNDTLEYAISGTDASVFSIESTSGQLKTSQALDYETKSSYSVTVSVTDNKGGTDSISVKITVTDVEETPISTVTGVCDRTEQVRDAIVQAARVDDCSKVTETHLAAISTLVLQMKSITSLKSGDFDGLSSLNTLILIDNDLTSLPDDIFDGLTALTVLSLDKNELTSLPTDVFDDLTSLRILNLSENDLDSLSDSVFDELAAVQQLFLDENELSSLPTGVFDGLDDVRTISLAGNDLTSLTDGVFDEITTLEALNLSGNDLTSLPADIFDEITSLRTLSLSENDLDSLPDGIFDEITGLINLHLKDIGLSSLPDGMFDDFTHLATLSLDDNDLSFLPADIFDENTALKEINLSGNSLSSISSDVFDENTALEDIDLSENSLSALPFGILDGLTALKTLELDGNSDNPLSLTVSLEKVSDGQFKAVAPIGAPFDIILPISATNGSISDDATSITISTGKVESDTLTITRTDGTTAAVTMDIGTLPSIPTSHNGYVLVKSTDLPLEVISPVGNAPATVNNSTSVLPGVTRLLSNYPNPFNPDTWIPYQLTEPADVTLTIYDVRGTIVRQFSLGYRPAGFYTSKTLAVYWDGKNRQGERVASSIYYCSLIAGDFTATRKILILK